MKIKKVQPTEQGGHGSITDHQSHVITQATYSIEADDSEERVVGFQALNKQERIPRPASGRLITQKKLIDSDGDLILHMQNGGKIRFLTIEEAIDEEDIGIYFFTGEFLDEE